MNQTSAQTVACPNCKQQNSAGAKFCGGCGGPLPGAQTFQAPPQPPPNYNMNFNTGGGGGTTQQVAMDPMSAAGAIQHAVQAAGGSITEAGPTGGAFVVPHSKFWLTMGMKVKVSGRFTVTANGQGGSTAQVTCSTPMNALTTVLGVNLLAGVLLLPLLPVAIGISAYVWWYYNGQACREIEGDILRRLGVAGVQPLQQPPVHQQAAPVRPMDPPPPAQTTGEDPYDQLRKLASLRDAAVITPEEYETKKAEILARL